VAGCLKSLLFQFAEHAYEIPNLESLYLNHSGRIPPIPKLLKTLKETLQTFHGAYVVIDALDECSKGDKLFSALKIMCKWKSRALSILVTSKDKPEGRKNLEPRANKDVSLENSTVVHYIGKFVFRTHQEDTRLG